MKMVTVLIIHLILQLLAAKVETESCLLKFIEGPPSSLACNPYNSYKRWGLRLTCQVKKSVDNMSIEYEIHWFQKDKNNDIIDHGRSLLSHKTGTVEIVEFGTGWYGRNVTNNMLGDFWCQVKLTDRKPPVYLSKSNILTVREPNYYNSSLPSCPGLLYVEQRQCLNIPSFTTYNPEITPTQTTSLNRLTTYSTSLQSYTTIVTDTEHPNTASHVLTTTITTTICLNIPSFTSYNPEITPTQTTSLNRLTTYSISLQSFATIVTDTEHPNTACHVLTRTITTTMITPTITTTMITPTITTSKWLSSATPTLSAKGHNFMDYVLPGIIILSAIVTLIILIIFAIIMMLILKVKRKKIRSTDFTDPTLNHQTSKEAEEDAYTTNMEPYYAPLTPNTTHKPLDNPYYQPNATVTDVIIYENDDRNIARHHYAAINPAQINNDVYTSLQNNKQNNYC